MDTSWKKMGLRVVANGSKLQNSHAMLPTPIHLGSVIRVFYASCDVELKGRIYFADLSPKPPYDVIRAEEQPVLDVGVGNDFDCDGVNPSQIVRSGEELILYYIGWRRVSREVPYTLIAGIASSRNGGRSFEKIGPFLPPSVAESYFRTAPFVYRDGSGWSALYIGGGRFIDATGGKRLPIYSLRCVYSTNGIDWPDGGDELLAPQVEQGEIGFGRPVLWHNSKGAKRLVLSRRTIEGYLLMQAAWPFTANNITELETVLEPGPDHWDKEMTCFGAFCSTEFHELLFYNGNQFGRSGFGLACRDVVRATLP